VKIFWIYWAFQHFTTGTDKLTRNTRGSLSLLLHFCLFEDRSEHRSVFNKNEKEICEKDQTYVFLNHIFVVGKGET